MNSHRPDTGDRTPWTAQRLGDSLNEIKRRDYSRARPEQKLRDLNNVLMRSNRFRYLETVARDGETSFTQLRGGESVGLTRGVLEVFVRHQLLETREVDGEPYFRPSQLGQLCYQQARNDDLRGG